MDISVQAYGIRLGRSGVERCAPVLDCQLGFPVSNDSGIDWAVLLLAHILLLRAFVHTPVHS